MTYQIIRPGLPLSISSFDAYYSCAGQAIGSGTFASPVSRTWPTTNLAYYYPIEIPWDYPVNRLFCINGGVASGHFDIGIYRIDGTRLLSTGSTAQSGITAAQYVSSPILLPRGAYYLAMSVDNTTAQFEAQAFTNVQNSRISGVLQQGTAFALPSTMTPVTAVAFSSVLMYWPLFGITAT